MVGDHLSGRRLALVVNPASRAGRFADPVRDVLRVAGSVTVVAGASADETAALLRAADCDAVVVLGGDGMVHLAVQELASTGTPLGIVPAGTGNDAADALGVPADPLRAAAAVVGALRDGSTRKIDLGRTGDGRWWLTVLCAGFDSAVNERANRLRWPRGPRRYDAALVAELLRLRPFAMRLTLDERTIELDATLVAVGNTPAYGGGKRITPAARVDDGLFEVCAVGPVTRRELARFAPKLPHGGHVAHPAVTMYRARRVALDGGVVAYADGERIGPLPVTAECVPAALTVLVPPARAGRPDA